MHFNSSIPCPPECFFQLDFGSYDLTLFLLLLLGTLFYVYHRGRKRQQQKNDKEVELKLNRSIELNKTTEWKLHDTAALNVLLGNALDKVPIGVAIIASNGRVHYANELAAPLLEQVNLAKINQEKQLTPGHSQSLMLRTKRGGAIQVLSTMLRPIEGDWLMLLRDHKPQQEAEASHARLTSTLSHEFLSPLTAIKGHLRHITEEIKGTSPAWIGSFNVVCDQTDRLERLASDHLILARYQSEQPLQFEQTDLVDLIENSLLEFDEKATAKKITFELIKPDQHPQPYIDRHAWRQVLLNLVDNAIKYGKQKVTIKLEVQGKTLTLSVTDNGIGIPPQDVSYIFDENRRAGNVKNIPGNGLGLAIVRHIVAKHSGQIRCASKVGQGTTFTITFPLDPRQ